MADARSRSWTFIVYPESAPENWKSELIDLHVPLIISPLHNKDKKEDGSLKKPHFHCLLLFPSKKSYSQAKELTDQLHAPIPKKVASVPGLVRYFAHLDDPQKAQYDPQEIQSFCGADASTYLTMTEKDRHEVLKELTGYILSKHLTSFSEVVKAALTQERDDWYTLIADKYTWYIELLVDSEWKLQHQGRYH